MMLLFYLMHLTFIPALSHAHHAHQHHQLPSIGSMEPPVLAKMEEVAHQPLMHDPEAQELQRADLQKPDEADHPVGEVEIHPPKVEVRNAEVEKLGGAEEEEGTRAVGSST